MWCTWGRKPAGEPRWAEGCGVAEEGPATLRWSIKLLVPTHTHEHGCLTPALSEHHTSGSPRKHQGGHARQRRTFLHPIPPLPLAPQDPASRRPPIHQGRVPLCCGPRPRWGHCMGGRGGAGHAGDSRLSEGENAVNTPRVAGFRLSGDEKQVQERR